MQLPHLFRRLRHAHLAVISILVLASGASANDAIVPGSGGTPAEKPAKITVKNLSGTDRKLKRVVVHKKNAPEPVEIIDVNKIVPKEGELSIECATFNSKDEVVISSTTWDLGAGLLPLLLRSTVLFADDTGGKDVIYTLMYSTQGEITYGLTAADLALCIPVPEGQTILVTNGCDRTGHFPPSVVFLDAATQTPITGSLTSAGEMEHLQVWTDGSFGGSSGLTGAMPRLDGDGQLTANGTISLLLSGAEPGGVAVLVAGFSEIDVPFAGTTLGPSPRFIVSGLLVDEWGNNELTLTLGELPAGLDICAQEFVLGPGGASSLSATNTLIGHSF
jgi:hypothetical protein